MNYVPSNFLLLGRALSKPTSPWDSHPVHRTASTTQTHHPCPLLCAASLLHVILWLKCPHPSHLSRSCCPPVPSHLLAQALLKKKKIKVEIHITQNEPLWSEQFHGIQYIHNVMQPPSPSSSKTFPAFQNKTLSSLNSPFNTLPAPGNHQSAFCLYGFAYLGYFIWMESHKMWPFVSGFIHSA